MELNFLVCLCTQIKLKKIFLNLLCTLQLLFVTLFTHKKYIYIYFVVYSLFQVFVDTVTKFLYSISLELSDALNMLSGVGQGNS